MKVFPKMRKKHYSSRGNKVLFLLNTLVMRKALYVIILTLNLILASFLVLAYLSTYISPAKVWFLAFTGLFYPYLLFLNIAFVLFWAVKWKREAFISLVIIVLGWNHMIDYVPFRLSTLPVKKLEENGERVSLKILSYNVRAFNSLEWLEDKKTSSNILNLIKSENPDIVCIQEFFTDHLRNKPDLIQQNFKDKPYSHIHYAISTGKTTGYGIATYSRYPIIGKGHIKFTETNNISIYTDILIENDTIRVYNNHLQSLHLKQSNYTFMESLKLGYSEGQVEEIRDISRRLKNAFVKRSVQVDSVSFHIKQSLFPVIVCGDFNDTPVSYTYRKMRSGLKDSFVNSGEGFGSTYLGTFPAFRIDYIFHSSFFNTTHFERIRAELSDHYPIICQLNYIPR
jgi:endonuclease/exonuclease/phosphatase family metal-dependent hydrolase